MQDQASRVTVIQQPDPSVEQIVTWLVNQVAHFSHISADEIDITNPFFYYGLDSAAAAYISGELELWLTMKLSPLLIWDYPNIQLLANYLAAKRIDHCALAA
jgi:acyl carrier protein